MKNISWFLFLLLITNVSAGQKKELDHSVYDSWQHIGERMISNDGHWVVYTIEPQQGDGELVIQSTESDYRFSVARGYNATITQDSRFVVFLVKPFFKDNREARIKKKKADEMPKDSLAVVELGKNSIWKTEKVKGYKVPQKGFGWMAYQLQKPVEQPGIKIPEKKSVVPDKRTTDSLNRVIDSLQQLLKKANKKGKIKIDDEEDAVPMADLPAVNYAEDKGADLVARNLLTGEEIVFYSVLDYYFSQNGEKLLVSQSKNPLDSFSTRQVILYDLLTNRTKVLSRGGNDFKNFLLNDEGSKVAFMAERQAGPRDLLKFYTLWYYRDGMDTAQLLADRYTTGMRLGNTLSETGAMNFSKSEKRLFFFAKQIPSPADTTEVDFETSKPEIWKYDDDYLRTVQNFRAKTNFIEQYLTVFDFETRTLKQVGSSEIPEIIQTNEGDGDVFIGLTDVGKRIESQWMGSTKKDVYAIDWRAGKKQLIKKDLLGQVYASPKGNYIAWYDRNEKNYFAWNGKNVNNLTEKIRVPLYNEEEDRPTQPSNYGIMGWEKDDAAVYVYDRYGFWRVDLNNGLAEDLGAEARKNKWICRYIQVDNEKRYFEKDDLLLLSITNYNDKSGGLSVYDLGKRAFTRINTGNSKGFISSIREAKQRKGNLLFSRESFTDSPDLYYITIGAAGNSTAPVKLSAINKQQEQYNWGNAELFTYKAYNGKEATGVLYRPENFDPRKKYPLLVYFYEKLSNEMYRYKEPAPIRSALNVPFFVSRGYLVFIPDIEYKTGHPGQSAYDYVVSGARALVKKGWVDSTRIGIQGHSWGGYQAAQLATMTKLFKAVWAGAPVANMTSAYGGIRWESGVNRQGQYETGQSRIGASLWDKLPLYIENSPLFHLQKVTAPMVIMSNDADGAVPWYQGIELFTALRRLGKKAWLFNYPGQGHGLTQRKDMLDYQKRMQEFFDWQLLGRPVPAWVGVE